MASAEGRTTPTMAERVDLAAHGLFTRVGLFLPVAVRDGVAAVALATGTAFALVYFWFSGWAPLMRGRDASRELFSFGPFVNPGVILCALWLFAFVCALLAWSRTAKIVLTGSILIAIAIPWTNLLVPAWDGPSSTNLGFFVILGLLAVAGTPRSRPRLAFASSVWLVAFVGLYAANGLLNGGGDRSFWTRIASPTNLLLAGLAAVMLTVVFLALRRRTAAVVVLGSLPPWIAVWGVGIMNDDPLTALVIAAIVVAVVPTLVAGAFALRRSGVLDHKVNAEDK
ncbi:hypothetical protein GY21_19985 [Cryobacterium roopkundense]|uniref:Uncharacterized protein n=1 Tax=Cryobacterium roopkundense TaxID=1001240 RepID=A0A099J2I6_9MICO|nr:hypothetical protein [Cryobacterium roopkundense]KGJ71762.1 hypothetical protein GY21_19985 [Cryobacterium roopkundense]MBB5640165.1 hypothetical protein [Cryobacterium roopkundense]